MYDLREMYTTKEENIHYATMSGKSVLYTDVQNDKRNKNEHG